MILIFCFQSNKHWHENEPRAPTSNEKMKLVFQLTDQKHFIHYNQAFIWRGFFYFCMRARRCVPRLCVCEERACTYTCKYIIHASSCASSLSLVLLLVVIATPWLQRFLGICNRRSCLDNMIFLILTPSLSLMQLSQLITDELHRSLINYHIIWFVFQSPNRKWN